MKNPSRRNFASGKQFHDRQPGVDPHCSPQTDEAAGMRAKQARVRCSLRRAERSGLRVFRVCQKLTSNQAPPKKRSEPDWEARDMDVPTNGVNETARLML